ncbi:MAG: hypothetical protein ACRECC_04340 [Pseudolabrys sp.]
MERTIGAAAIVLFCAIAAAAAQPAPTQRISGTVESAKGNTIVVRPHAGSGTFEINLTDKAAVIDVSKGTLADVKPGAFIGVGAMPQADGSQRAIQVTVFAESQRGTGEGFRPWDARPNSTMTNATVSETVESVDGQVVMVKYKGGEKKIIVPPDATILAYSVGDKSELKPGVNVAILRAKKTANGALEADRVNVGRGGVVPH